MESKALHQAITRFPERWAQIRSLYSESDEFRSICADYESAIRASQYWQDIDGNAHKKQEYSEVAEQLEAEMLVLIDSSEQVPTIRTPRNS